MAALAVMKKSRSPEIRASTEDAILIERAIEGDGDSFERLIRKHEGPAYRFALALTKNPDDAADVLSVSVLRAFRGIRKFRGASGFATWLHRIILNSFNDAKRRSGRAPTTSIEGMVEKDMGASLSPQLIAEEGDPGREFEIRDRSERLGQAASLLGVTGRRLIALRHFEEMPYSQIAKVENAPIGTIKSRLHRARRAMRAHLVEADL